MQEGSQPVQAQLLKAGGRSIFHWTNRSGKRSLQVRILRTNDGSMWSSSFRISNAGDQFMVKVRRPASRNSEHLVVAVT